MDAIVTARVPVELKEQGGEILRSIGASQTDLVNSAYRFLLSTRRLPSVESDIQSLPKGHRGLSPDQKRGLRAAFGKMRLGTLDDDDFKKQLDAARDERFAAIHRH